AIPVSLVFALLDALPLSISRRTMFAPMRPRPTIPSCIPSDTKGGRPVRLTERGRDLLQGVVGLLHPGLHPGRDHGVADLPARERSEEHTSELQSRETLVC